MGEEVVEHLRNDCRADVTIRYAVDLNGRGQRATAQTADLLNRERSILVGVFVLAEVQFTRYRVVYGRRALEVAGGAIAYGDCVFSGGLCAKLREESGYALNNSGGDFGGLADAP
jgi:hypothetical protein